MYQIITSVFLIIISVLLIISTVGNTRLNPNEIEKIRQWILYAMIEAEKKFGSQTGKIKLRYVYDLFIDRFSNLSRCISFEDFESIVDNTMETFNTLINTNEKLNEYVKGDKNE